MAADLGEEGSAAPAGVDDVAEAGPAVEMSAYTSPFSSLVSPTYGKETC